MDSLPFIPPDQLKRLEEWVKRPVDPELYDIEYELLTSPYMVVKRFADELGEELGEFFVAVAFIEMALFVVPNHEPPNPPFIIFELTDHDKSHLGKKFVIHYIEDEDRYIYFTDKDEAVNYILNYLKERFESCGRTPIPKRRICHNNTCHKSMTSAKKCGGCRKVYYCSRDCQNEDWNNHKLSC